MVSPGDRDGGDTILGFLGLMSVGKHRSYEYVYFLYIYLKNKITDRIQLI